MVFGDIIDGAASQVDPAAQINSSVILMLYLAAASFVASIGAFAFFIISATRQTFRIRKTYLNAVLKQDMPFFDDAMPGSITSRINEDILLIQEGMAQRVAEFIQAVMQLVAGFAVAFYFGWELTLVLCSCVPILGVLAVVMFSLNGDGSKIGLEAYAEASTIATETLASMRTVLSFRGEKAVAEVYDEKLDKAEKTSTKMGWKTAALMGALMVNLVCCFQSKF